MSLWVALHVCGSKREYLWLEIVEVRPEKRQNSSSGEASQLFH